MAKILVVEDNPGMRKMLVQALTEKDYDVTEVADGLEAARKIETEGYDLIITDLKLPGIDGLEVLKKAKENNPNSLVIIITAFGTVENAVEAMRQGAYDYILKPFSIKEVYLKIEKALSQQSILSENIFLKEEIRSRFGRLIGSSAKMQEIYQLIEKVAKSSSPVIILGESGTGKELVAREIHERSVRKDKPFVPVNCAALAEGVLESELFGHEKGAFTGAVMQKKGRFELADKGTLFLDEIGDLPLNIQVKLLRVLQEQEFERVGGTKSVKVDVRIIAATNRDLKKAIEDGKFREDLFYRINVVPISLPYLRDRKEDIPELMAHFLQKYNSELHKNIKFSKDTMNVLTAYNWHGNVRELENIIERIVVLADKGIVEPDDLPKEFIAGTPDAVSNQKGLLTNEIETIERERIREILEQCKWNQTEAALRLGLKRTSLQYKMKKYNLLKDEKEEKDV
ncbi:MAG: sigma-54 dependent transcriptional regulator [Nitrospirota bacterium]